MAAAKLIRDVFLPQSACRFSKFSESVDEMNGVNFHAEQNFSHAPQRIEEEALWNCCVFC